MPSALGSAFRGGRGRLGSLRRPETLLGMRIDRANTIEEDLPYLGSLAHPEPPPAGRLGGADDPERSVSLLSVSRLSVSGKDRLRRHEPMIPAKGPLLRRSGPGSL